MLFENFENDIYSDYKEKNSLIQNILIKKNF